MRIWVDGQCFQTGSNVRGIGRYVIEFLSALIRKSEGMHLIISLNGNMKEEAISARQYIEAKLPECEIAIWYGIAKAGEFQEGYSEERRADEHILAAHINGLAPDLALSPSPFEGYGDRSSPFIKSAYVDSLTACIFYDAIPYRYPEIYLRQVNAYKLYMRRFDEISGFNLVLSISEYTNSEYRQIYKKKNSITIGAGVSETFLELAAEWGIEQSRLGKVLGQYALYVGATDWRKNIAVLVEALSHVAEFKCGDFKLVIAGKADADEVARLRDLWVNYGLPSANFVPIGWVTDTELVDLYSCAEVTLQPSRLEGFGLSALEAWACKSPYLSANGGAANEVVGDDRFLFDPDAPMSLAGLISRVLHDEDFRHSQILYGAQRIKAFNWENSASKAYEAIKAALGDLGRTADTGNIKTWPDVAGKRLIIDVTATAQCSILSGIQRTVYNLTTALKQQNCLNKVPVILGYCRDVSGWYEIEASKCDAISLDPSNKIVQMKGDTYLLLDNSWEFIESQRSRVLDALIQGQEVISCVYDIGPLVMSAMANADTPEAFTRWFEFALGHSTALVCNSKSVIDEIYQILEGINFSRPMKLGYFPLGADFSEIEADATGLDFLNERPNFLMVGTIEPRKGHLIAFRAFEQLWREGYDINLVIVGKAGWDTEMTIQLLSSHAEIGHRLHWISEASDGNLREAYDSAAALVMSSYLEGFGLPIIEAGRLGKPVILSDLTVFREAAAGAPWTAFFECGNSESLANVVRDFIRNPPKFSTSESMPWPTWSQSAEQLSRLVFGNKWQKRYAPVTHPSNALSGAPYDIRMKFALSEPIDRAHAIRIVEGPLISDLGRFLRIAVAIQNKSKNTWSSRNSESGIYGVVVGCHLYGDDLSCVIQDGPRAAIPFVLLPGQEICVPIRVPLNVLRNGITNIGIQLFQEGIGYFGDEIRLNLLQPVSADFSNDMPEHEASIIYSDEMIGLFLCNDGQFGDDNGGRHYLFSILNRSDRSLPLLTADGSAAFSVGYVLGESVNEGGAWVVSCAKSVAPSHFGYLYCYVSNSFLAIRSQLIVQYENSSQNMSWAINFETGKISYLESAGAAELAMGRNIEAEARSCLQQQPESNGLVRLLSRLPYFKAQQRNELVQVVKLSLDASPMPIMRGFNEPEPTHTWMKGHLGEIQVPDTQNACGYLRFVDIHCAAIDQAEGALSLDLTIEGLGAGPQQVSAMGLKSYRFEVSKSMANKFLMRRIIGLRADGFFYIGTDQRQLSIAVSRITLTFTQTIDAPLSGY